MAIFKNMFKERKNRANGYAIEARALQMGIDSELR